MNQEQFMLLLAGGLKRLPAPEREEIIADYRSHFAEGLNQGYLEEEIALSLGDPFALAQEYEVALLLHGTSSKRQTKSVRLVMKIIGISFVWLILLLPIFLAINLITFSFLISGIALIIYTPICLFLYAIGEFITSYGLAANLLLLVGGLMTGLALTKIFYGACKKVGKATLLVLRQSFAQGGRK